LSGIGAAFGAEFGEVVLDHLGVFFFGGWWRRLVAVVVEVAGELGEGTVGGVEFDHAGEAAAVGFAELFELAFVGEATAEAGLEGVADRRQGTGDRRQRGGGGARRLGGGSRNRGSRRSTGY
jgi:hypothetical protein